MPSGQPTGRRRYIKSDLRILQSTVCRLTSDARRLPLLESQSAPSHSCYGA